MRELDANGRIHLPKKKNGVPCFKRFLSDSKGQIPPNVWTDISPLQGASKERTSYPTQKPLALLERIIKASSNPGAFVLDPFCGCGTACVAADSLGRQWLGIDISPKAAELVVHRIAQAQGPFKNIIHRTDTPHRTDLGDLPL